MPLKQLQYSKYPRTFYTPEVFYLFPADVQYSLLSKQIVTQNFSVYHLYNFCQKSSLCFIPLNTVVFPVDKITYLLVLKLLVWAVLYSNYFQKKYYPLFLW